MPRIAQTKHVSTSCQCGFKLTLRIRALYMVNVDRIVEHAICQYTMAHHNTICKLHEPISSYPSFAEYKEYKQKEKEITDELRRDFEARGERGSMVEILCPPGMPNGGGVSGPQLLRQDGGEHRVHEEDNAITDEVQQSVSDGPEAVAGVLTGGSTFYIRASESSGQRLYTSGVYGWDENREL